MHNNAQLMLVAVYFTKILSLITTKIDRDAKVRLTFGTFNVCNGQFAKFLTTFSDF